LVACRTSCKSHDDLFDKLCL